MAPEDLNRAASMPLEGHDEEWLRFMAEVLKMPACYLPAAQKILHQGAWRRYTGTGQNPIGYVKTAAYREALKMGLAMDRYEVTEPRVLTKDQPRRQSPTVGGCQPLPVPIGMTHDDYIESLQGGCREEPPAARGARDPK